MNTKLEKAKRESQEAARIERCKDYPRAIEHWKRAKCLWEAVGSRENVKWCKARIIFCASIFAGDCGEEI